MAPLFSVVIPTFNRSDLFPYAVKSILNQSLQDFEIILSDNCSGDDTAAVAKTINDPRVKYICAPRHFTIADNWEFGRKQATGNLIIMLSDDDALVPSALESFAKEVEDCDTDFIFSNRAEYRDSSFPGPDKNSVSCPGFSAGSRVVSLDEFVRPLYAFRPKFDMHPSAFVFPRKIADYVVERTGRFFWTNGVEYSAWPITAVFAKRIVYVDLPLTVLGRTVKSWGTNVALCNPGKEKLQTFFNDVDQHRVHAPLHNFTMTNLMAEGMLTAKHLFKDEFATYEFDELRYLKGTMKELRKREAMGVDVSVEIDDTLRYASKYPTLENALREIKAPIEPDSDGFVRLIRTGIGTLGARKMHGRIRAIQLSQKLKKGEASQGFQAAGNDFGFSDVLECAQFLERNVITAASRTSSHRYP